MEDKIDLKQNKCIKKKKMVKTLIIVIICSIVSIIIWLITGFFGYFSMNFKTDRQVKDYLTKYINEKYNIDCTLKFNSKKLIDICDFWFDGCISIHNNINVYEYFYSGTDKNNNEFIVEYTNSYMDKGRLNKSYIKENYYIYKHIEEMKKILNSYYDTFDVYYRISNEDMISNDIYSNIVIRIYDSNENTNNLVEVNDKILKFCDHFKIIYTTDHSIYEEILKNNYEIEDITKNFKYKCIKYSIQNNNYKKELSNIKLTNHKHIVELNNYDETSYYIYEKKK